MTSNKRRSTKMKPIREKTRTNKSRNKSAISSTQKQNLPLFNKLIYMDLKHGKQAELIEEQLKTLGAKVEKFLSSEVNYVISLSAPSKHSDKFNTWEENPQSPSFCSLTSPFNCGPSPTGQADVKRTVVSRGKALAQIACAKSQASSVVANAEKLGIKVITLDAASKWLEKELKKLDKEFKIESVNKEEDKVKQKSKNQENKKKKKLLKGSYIKFEVFNQLYRPVKSEFSHWPKLNLLAPPGICPFGEAKLKVQYQYKARKCLPLTSNVPSVEFATGNKLDSAEAKPQEIRISQPVPELVGVPIVTTGDIKCNLALHLKKSTQINKQQGYCDCCEVKFKDLDQHLTGDEHRAFIRDKSNYESLDAIISKVPCTVEFLQTVLLKHCVEKQEVVAERSQDPVGNILHLDPPISPLTTEKTVTRSIEIAPFSHNTPHDFKEETFYSREKFTATDNDVFDKVGSTPLQEANVDNRPQAIVIRRPTPSGIFTSPRRRQPTPGKKPWVQERSMIFRDSPMASLQPSCSSSPSFVINDGVTNVGILNGISAQIPTGKLITSQSHTRVSELSPKVSSANNDQLNHCGSKTTKVSFNGTPSIGSDIKKCVSITRDKETNIPDNCQQLERQSKEVNEIECSNLKLPSSKISDQDLLQQDDCHRSDLAEDKILLDDKKYLWMEKSIIGVSSSGICKNSADGNLRKKVTKCLFPAEENLKTNFENNVFSENLIGSCSNGDHMDNIKLKLDKEIKIKENNDLKKEVDLKETSDLTSDNDKNVANDLKNCSMTTKIQNDNGNEIMIIESDSDNLQKTQVQKHENEMANDSNDQQEVTDLSNIQCESISSQGIVLPSIADRVKQRSRNNSGISYCTVDENNLMGSPGNTRATDNEDRNILVTPQTLTESLQGKHMEVTSDFSSDATMEYNEIYKTEVTVGYKTEMKNGSYDAINEMLSDSSPVGSLSRLNNMTSGKCIKCNKLEGGCSTVLDINKYRAHCNMFSQAVNAVQNDNQGSTASSGCRRKRKNSSPAINSCNNFKGKFNEKSIMRPELGLKENMCDSAEIKLKIQESDMLPGLIPNIADRVKTRTRVMHMSGHSANDESVELSDKNECKFKKRNRRRDHHLKVKSRHSDKKIKKKGKAFEKNSKPADIAHEALQPVVPNIAECVKRRRSCTLFNHEGQYANSGESSAIATMVDNDFSTETLGCRKNISRSRKNSDRNHQLAEECSKVSLTAVNLSEIRDKEKRSDILSSTKTAVVIRRKNNIPRSFSYMYRKSAWGRFQTKKDWSRSEAIKEISPQNLTIKTDSIEDASNAKLTKDTIQHVDKIKQYNLKPLMKVNPKYSKSCAAEFDASKINQTPPKKLINHHAIKLHGLTQTASSQSPSISNSPKLKLRIVRQPDNGYSSTLEEIYDYSNSYSQNHLATPKSPISCHQTSSKVLLEKSAVYSKTLPNNFFLNKCSTSSDSETVILLSSSPAIKQSRMKRQFESEECSEKEDVSEDHSVIFSSSEMGGGKTDRKRKKRRRLELENDCPSLKQEPCGQTDISMVKITYENQARPQSPLFSSPSRKLSLSKKKNSIKKSDVGRSNSPIFNKKLKEKIMDSGVAETNDFLPEKVTSNELYDPRPKRKIDVNDSSSFLSPSVKKVKLSDNWRLLSDRSMVKLLETEQESDSFEGFKESPSQGLASDLTYINASEVDMVTYDDKEWVIDTNVKSLLDESPAILKDLNYKEHFKKVNRELEESSNHGLGDFMTYVTEFSSPDKVGGSSWGDVCESYLNTPFHKPSQSSLKISRMEPSPFKLPCIVDSPMKKRTPHKLDRPQSCKQFHDNPIA